VAGDQCTRILCHSLTTPRTVACLGGRYQSPPFLQVTVPQAAPPCPCDSTSQVLPNAACNVINRGSLTRLASSPPATPLAASCASGGSASQARCRSIFSAEHRFSRTAFRSAPLIKPLLRQHGIFAREVVSEISNLIGCRRAHLGAHTLRASTKHETRHESMNRSGPCPLTEA
jgi:hypothetical protein